MQTKEWKGNCWQLFHISILQGLGPLPSPLHTHPFPSSPRVDFSRYFTLRISAPFVSRLSSYLRFNRQGESHSLPPGRQSRLVWSPSLSLAFGDLLARWSPDDFISLPSDCRGLITWPTVWQTLNHFRVGLERGWRNKYAVDKLKQKLKIASSYTMYETVIIQTSKHHGL